MTEGSKCRSLTGMGTKVHLFKLRSYFALLKPNTANTLQFCSKCPAVHLTDSFESVRAEWTQNCRSHNSLESCQIFSLAPVVYDVG